MYHCDAAGIDVGAAMGAKRPVLDAAYGGLGGMLLGLRGLVGIVQDILAVIVDSSVAAMFFYDIWFVLGGVLFLLLAVLVRHQRI